METSYGVGTSNRFALFLEEENIDSTTEIKVQDKTKDKKEKKITKPITKPANTNTAQKPTQPLTRPITNQAPEKPRQKRPQTQRPDQSAPRPSADEPQSQEKREFRRRPDYAGAPAAGGQSSEFRERGGDGENRPRGRGGFRGARGARGARGGGRNETRGKREFDRQSGSDRSGIKPMDKREGAGAHNWGTVQDDLDVQLNAAPEESDKPEGDTTLPEDAENKEDGEPKEAVEPEPTEITYEEYRKQQETLRSKAHFNLRKPGEGADNGQWNKTYVLKKKEEQVEEDEEEDDDDTQRGRQKKVVDIIKFTFPEQPGNRRGRGGRGRGQRGQGPPRERPERSDRGDRDQERRQQLPRVDDWNDFPSLITAS